MTLGVSCFHFVTDIETRNFCEIYVIATLEQYIYTLRVAFRRLLGGTGGIRAPKAGRGVPLGCPLQWQSRVYTYGRYASVITLRELIYLVSRCAHGLSVLGTVELYAVACKLYSGSMMGRA